MVRGKEKRRKKTKKIFEAIIVQVLFSIQEMKSLEIGIIRETGRY